MRGGRSPRNLKSGHSHLNVAQLPPAPGRCWIVLPSLHVANGVDLWETDTEVICINRGCFAFPPFIPPNVWIKPRSDVGKQHRSGGKLFGWQRSLMCTSPIERGLLIMNYEICFFFPPFSGSKKGLKPSVNPTLYFPVWQEIKWPLMCIYNFILFWPVIFYPHGISLRN